MHVSRMISDTRTVAGAPPAALVARPDAPPPAPACHATVPWTTSGNEENRRPHRALNTHHESQFVLQAHGEAPDEQVSQGGQRALSLLAHEMLLERTRSIFEPLDLGD